LKDDEGGSSPSLEDAERAEIFCQLQVASEAKLRNHFRLTNTVLGEAFPNHTPAPYCVPGLILSMSGGEFRESLPCDNGGAQDWGKRSLLRDRGRTDHFH
jgi:hypothetical protein